MTDTTNALRALLRKLANNGELFRDDPALHMEVCRAHDALATAQPEAKGEGVDWRAKAAEWLCERAARQEANNARWPDHAACYESWRRRPGELRDLAFKLTGDESVLARQAQGGGEEIPDPCSGPEYEEMLRKGAEAWKDVPDGAAWVREIRGDDEATRPPEDTER